MGAIVDATNPRKMIVVIAHEISSSTGIVRAHGQRGAFVSRFVIDRVSCVLFCLVARSYAVATNLAHTRR